jgi:hypothetical protein
VTVSNGSHVSGWRKRMSHVACMSVERIGGLRRTIHRAYLASETRSVVWGSGFLYRVAEALSYPTDVRRRAPRRLLSAG